MNNDSTSQPESQTNSPPSVTCRDNSKPRNEAPYVWQAEAAIEQIVSRLGTTDGAFGVAIYVALSRFANNARSARFEASIGAISHTAAVSYPKTKDVLEALETTAKVIAIERQKRQKGQIRQLPHIYTLLALRLNAVKSDKAKARLNSNESHKAKSDLTETPPLRLENSNTSEPPTEVSDVSIEKDSFSKSSHGAADGRPCEWEKQSTQRQKGTNGF